MVSLADQDWFPPESKIGSIHYAVNRGLGTTPSQPMIHFSPARTRAILIVGVTSASISLICAITAFQWFAFMKRSFRHHLIFLLILSDMWKALWYFLFPIVVFTRGPVSSESYYCQASGFFTALGTEASDYAILMIALHSAFYVFRPPKRYGEGGLYSVRYYIYMMWIIFPVSAASLGFTNPGGFVSAGTYCGLPKRPFWYRLGLSYVPRYIIFFTIFASYAAITIYVNRKFKGFGSNDDEDSHSSYHNGYRLWYKSNRTRMNKSRTLSLQFKSSSVIGVPTDNSDQLAQDDYQPPEARPPWEDVNFITSAPLRRLASTTVVEKAVIVPEADLPTSSQTREDSKQDTKRRQSGATTLDTAYTGDTVHTGDTTYTGDTAVTTLDTSLTRPELPTFHSSNHGTCEHHAPPAVTTTDDDTSTTATYGTATTEQLADTRAAILRQLRLLFIYPIVYVTMWIFPFTNHCLQYSDYFAANPPLWLAILTTSSLALQAGADCAVFTWREKPWRRVRSVAPLSAGHLRKLRKLRRLAWGKNRNASGSGSLGGAGEKGKGKENEKEKGKRESHWWEAEGMKRKDSVWMGTEFVEGKCEEAGAGEGE